MQKTDKWIELNWRHPVWEVIRYLRALRGEKAKRLFLNELSNEKTISIGEKTLPITDEVVELLFDYVNLEASLFDDAQALLRTEEEALRYCLESGFAVGSTTTKSADHHQSSKAMIACVTGIARDVCRAQGVELNDDPQNRCIWLNGKELHITSRNLDGAIPSLVNPTIVWEIKEYWGKTKGGSKMSDAVYECQLVGRELREFEEKSGSKVLHIVFLDGKDQWSHRKSDLRRFIDLTYQGLIDHLIVGSEVERDWCPLLENSL